MSKEIILFGVGHLAKFITPLLKANYNITGLSRSFSCLVNDEITYKMGSSLSQKIEKSPECIIVNFPPRDELTLTLKKINDYFDDNTPLIFVSSTSIYSCGKVDEQSELNKSSRLYPFENLISHWQRPTVVLRPGGLFDKIRNPANFFKNRLEVLSCDNPVNMVHCQDVASFIKYVIDNQLYGGQYNLIASTHPTKKEFYGKAIKLSGYQQPIWKKEGAQAKLVLNDKSLATGFKYKYDNLLLALDIITN